MPGPPPKLPGLRQRRNKASTRATLPPDGSQSARAVPKLLDRACCGSEDCQACEGTGAIQWHPEALAFWADVWRSPMSTEYVQADVHGLFMLADLVDRYWRGDTELAAEIRLQRQCYGLTSLDRRRLQWEVARGEEAEAKRTKRNAPPVPTRKRRGDPRNLLRMPAR